MPDPATLQRFRTAVDREKSGTQLAEIVDDLHQAGYTTMAHEVLKDHTKGFAKDHPRIDLLRHKGNRDDEGLAGGGVARHREGPRTGWSRRCGPGCRSTSGCAATLPDPMAYDLAVVGAGIIGLAVAREWETTAPDDTVVILERETAPAQHQTGHNPGVIHGGIHYQPGSLKARLCVEVRG